MLNVVLDTNVLVAGLRSRRGASHRILQLLGRGGWQTNISVALALEYEDVLKRTSLVQSFTPAEVDAFLDFVFGVSNLEPFVMRLRPSLRDPDDDRILEVAVHCRATIVTHNCKDFVGAERFGVAVMTPGGFLKNLGVTE